jgi:dolichyl-phosphate-mannose-protein mannosyltransferase
MRFLPALFGVLTAPVGYSTMRNFGFSEVASLLTGLLVVFENSLVCQSRLILLDSFLVFFTALTALAYSHFLKFKHEPFSTGWWKSLTFVGISLGLTLSVKWVGLFTVGTIGVATVGQLWNIVCDGSIPLRVFYRHLMARVLTLIAIPLTIYMYFFSVHFSILSKMGPGSNQMSPEFQSTLKGSPIIESHAEVAYGSTIIFRHEGSKGGYLHSHPHVYPGGSMQQQITCYPFKDLNSDFLVKKPLTFVNKEPVDHESVGFEKIHHNSQIRLQHIPTGARLHSHSIRPGFNDDKEINEVTGYGTTKILGDANDHWVVEIPGAKDDTVLLQAITQQFRLKHPQTGCYLASRDHKLPDWAFGQQEVYCSSKARYQLTLWRIEGSSHPEMPAESKKIRYKHQSFFEKFWELHRVMWAVNNNLKASHPYGSKPSQWPLLDSGISYWRSKPDTKGIYFVGNPLIWIPGFFAIAIFAAYFGIDLILEKRKIYISRSGYFKAMVSGCSFYALGYLMHYFPFFLMGRQVRPLINRSYFSIIICQHYILVFWHWEQSLILQLID